MIDKLVATLVKKEGGKSGEGESMIQNERVDLSLYANIKHLNEMSKFLEKCLTRIDSINLHELITKLFP